MNENGKLAHSIAGAIVTWILAGIAWCAAHLGLIATFFAVIASIYSIRAAREARNAKREEGKYWQAKRRQLTSDPNQEPETDE